MEISARFTSVSWSTAVCAFCVVPTCYRVGGEQYRIYAVNEGHAHRGLERLELLLLELPVVLYLLCSLRARLLELLHTVWRSAPMSAMTSAGRAGAHIGGPAGRPWRPPSRPQAGSVCSVIAAQPMPAPLRSACAHGGAASLSGTHHSQGTKAGRFETPPGVSSTVRSSWRATRPAHALPVLAATPVS